MKRICFIVIIMASILGISNPISGQQNIPNYLARAVNIQSHEQQIGSGFYFEFEDEVFLITAAHVLYTKTAKSEISDVLSLDTIFIRSYAPMDYHNKTILISVNLNANKVIAKHPTKDICIVKIASKILNKKTNRYYYQPIKGAYVLENNGDIAFFSENHVLAESEIIEGMDILAMGYPSYLDPKPIFGQEVYDFKFPLVREGVLSGKSQQYENLIISSPVFYGNSGGAVLY